MSFSPLTANAKACGFVVYQNNKLFQSKTFIAKSHFSQKIISSKTDENVEDQSTSVEMFFSPRVSFPINRNNSAHFWLQNQGQFGQKKFTEQLFERFFDSIHFNLPHPYFCRLAKPKINYFEFYILFPLLNL